MSGTTLSVSRPFGRRLVFVRERAPACVCVCTFWLTIYRIIYILSISPYIFEIIYFKELSSDIILVSIVIWSYTQTVQNIYYYSNDYSIFIRHRHVFYNNIIITRRRAIIVCVCGLRLRTISRRATVQQWCPGRRVIRHWSSLFAARYLLIDLIRICSFRERFDFFGHFNIHWI